MTDLIQQAFGLTRQPFAKDIPAERLWLDNSRQSAIDRLIEAVQHHRHALVTTHYVRARLDAAGARSELVTPDGFALLHELSGGVLRTIDVLATAALRIAAVEEKRLIDRHLVMRALHTTPLA